MRERLIELANRAQAEGFKALADAIRFVAEDGEKHEVETLIYEVFENRL